MAHHPSTAPRALPRRTALTAVAVVLGLAVVLSLILWQAGGFAAAGDPPPRASGATIRTDLFSIEVPDEATLITQESDVRDTEFKVAVRTKLTSHETSPVPASVILGFIQAVPLPTGEKADPDGIAIARDAGTNEPYPWVQPATTETVTLSWELPDTGRESASQVEEVKLLVADPVYDEGFLDGKQEWRTTDDKRAGTAVAPVTHVTEEG